MNSHEKWLNKVAEECRSEGQTTWASTCALAAQEIAKDQAELARLLERVGELEWQPIDSAPKDGTQVFIWNADPEFPTFFHASWREPNESEFWVSGGSEPSTDDGTFGPDPGWFSDEGFVLKLAHATHWRPMFKPPHLAPLIAEAVKEQSNG